MTEVSMTTAPVRERNSITVDEGGGGDDGRTEKNK